MTETLLVCVGVYERQQFYFSFVSKMFVIINALSAWMSQPK